MGMSNAEGTLGPRYGRSKQDPVTGFLFAVRDAWLAGAALKESLTASSVGGGNPEATPPGAGLMGPMIGGLDAMADFASANRQRSDPPRAAAAASPPAPRPNIAQPGQCGRRRSPATYRPRHDDRREPVGQLLARLGSNILKSSSKPGSGRWQGGDRGNCAGTGTPHRGG